MTARPNPLSRSVETLVLSSGFGPGVSLVPHSDGSLTLTGRDRNATGETDWGRPGAGLRFGFHTQGYDGRSAFELVPDPAGGGRRVLRCRVIDVGHEGKNGRAQGSFFMSDGDDGRLGFQRFRFRMYIPEDYRLLVGMPPDGPRSWTDFWEIWAPRCGKEEEVANLAGAFRVCFSFRPDEEGRFVWHFTGHDMGGRESELFEGWHRENREIPVPFGAWSEWEFTVAKGPPERAFARVRVLLPPSWGEGGRVQANPSERGSREESGWATLFEVTGERMDHERLPRRGWYQVAPFKNYLGPDTVRHLLSRGARDVSLYYDDFSYWVGERED